MLLTEQTLAELTDRPRAKEQIEWLQSNGWKFEISAAGKPKVSKAYFDFRMGHQGSTAWQPDWSKV